MPDRVFGVAFSFDCRIGFRDFERQIRQRVVVDWVAETDWRRNAVEDDPHGIVDYYEVNRRLAQVLGEREYLLIEAVAEDVARVIVTEFPVLRATVKVSKTPFDMPNVVGVAVECSREPMDFQDEAQDAQGTPVARRARPLPRRWRKGESAEKP